MNTDLAHITVEKEDVTQELAAEEGTALTPVSPQISDPWVCLNAVDASIDLQNHQKTISVGYAGREMHLGHYF